MNSKVFINGALYNVLFYDTEIDRLKEALTKFTKVAIAIGKYVYPVFIASEFVEQTMPGVYLFDNLFFANIVHPTNDNDAMYSVDNIAYLDGDNMEELMDNQAKLAKAESSILTSANPESIFHPNIDPMSDSPLMFALKQAVAEKGIDLNKYADRFGSDFNNDRRKFNANKISIDKFSSIASKLDMKATLILEDADPKPGELTVPNPIGHTITVQLFPGGGENSDED